MDDIILELNMYDPDDVRINGIRYIVVSAEIGDNIKYTLKNYDKYLEENKIIKK